MRWRPASLALAVTLGAAAGAAAQEATPAGITPFVRNWTRVEVWRFFEPHPGGGDPDTAHIGNRLYAGVRGRWARLDATAALQYVQFGGLPTNASGPGALGTGALYYDHSSSPHSHQVYLKALHVALREWKGFDVQVGRMPYASGGERASGVPKVESLKRMRIDARLVGEFEWSLYQRAFDGLRVDWASDSWTATAAALRPTQGGFEDAAGVGISGIDIFTGAVTSGVGALVPGAEIQAFATRYNDRRRVTARPDNAGRAGYAADVGIMAVGGHLIASRPAGAGEIDVLVWAAGQVGHWYELDQRAVAGSAEAGYQWGGARWSPWLRGGLLYASGDGSPLDGRHGTFFPMVPTARRYSQSTLYTLSNVRDVFVQLLVQPHRRLTARADARTLTLASAADRWYAGSGATQEEGRIFGYTTRPSGDATGLMRVLEGSIDWRMSRHFSVNAYAVVATSGPVVRASFQSGPATFLYLETVAQF